MSDGGNIQPFPSQSNTPKVNPDDISTFWSLFRNVSFLEGAEEFLIEHRAVGKDTQTDQPIFDGAACQPWLMPGDAAIIGWLANKARAAAKKKMGSFMCPGVLNYRKAKDDTVVYLVCLTLDLDSGDTEANLAKAVGVVGQPTLVVKSGGVTPEGKPKYHVHWRLQEPSDEVKRVARLRERMALAFGGDASFKRIPQIIRIPGTVYDKTEPAILVTVADYNPDAEVELSDVEDAVPEVGPQSGQSVIPFGQSHVTRTDQGMNFGFNPEVAANTAEENMRVLSETIHEGGTPEDSRYSRFTQCAGMWISSARTGRCTIEEAYEQVCNWTQLQMSPPWPDARIRDEFAAILAVDKQNHPEAYAEQEPQPPVEDKEDWTLEKFRADQYYDGTPPPIPWIVENVLIEGSVHALVADGGVGKTYLALDIGLKVAAGDPSQRVFGFDVKRAATTVVLTVEDTKDDIHRRLHALDKDYSLRRKTEGRLYVLPVLDELVGGLTLVEKDQRGNHKPSAAWDFLVQKITAAHARHPDTPLVVIVDTYSATMHADENTSVGTNEWFRALAMLRRETNAAFLVTHHIKKTSMDMPIKSIGDFRAMIRGSTAFQNNCRAVFGVWEFPCSETYLAELGLEPGTKLFNLGLVKSNTAIDWSSRLPEDCPGGEAMLTLRRLGDGNLLYDAHTHDRRNAHRQEKDGILKDVMLEACRAWEAQDHPIYGAMLNNEDERELVLPPRYRGKHGGTGKKAMIAALNDLTKGENAPLLKVEYFVGKGSSRYCYITTNGKFDKSRDRLPCQNKPTQDNVYPPSSE